MSIPTISDSDGATFLTNLNAAFQTVYKDQQVQVATAFTTGGTAPTFTLTPSPAITSYAASQRFRVKWSAAAASPTLNISGLGALNVKQYTGKGTKIPAVVQSGQLTDVEYDGADLVVLDAIQPQSQGALVNYKASCTGLSASISMSADLVTVRDANGGYIELANVSVTLNTAGTGAGGLDTGSLGANTWYNKFIIYNPTTGAVSALCSLSATGPTMPSGYTHWKRTGAFRTDGTANKFPVSMTWTGNRAQYKPAAGSNLTGLLAMASGTSVAWGTAVAVGAFVPPTAVTTQVVALTGSIASGQWVAVAPNGSYASNSVAPIFIVNGGASGITANMLGSLVLESMNIYWGCSSPGATLAILGWEDAN